MVFHPGSPSGQTADAHYLSEIRRLTVLHIGTAFVFFLIGAVLAIAMRGSQAAPGVLDPARYYWLMTLHGVSMIYWAVVAMIGVGWFVLTNVFNQRPSLAMARIGYILFLVAGAGAAVAVLVGRFSSGFPMLYPMPFRSAGYWDPWAAGLFLTAVLVLGVGALIFSLVLLKSIQSAFGGVSKGLGLHHVAQFITGRRADDNVQSSSRSVAGMACTVGAIAAVYAILVGAVLILMILIRAFIYPGLNIDYLIAKNMGWMFSHTLANLSMYFGIAAMYLIIPAVTGRPWKDLWLYSLAWILLLFGMVFAFSHHLYMDFSQPMELNVLGWVSSYVSGVPVVVITIFSAWAALWKSGVRWTPAVKFAYAGLFGYMVGGIGAVVDATIPLNQVLHNTLWVPAHFHSYFLLGFTLFIFAFIYQYLPNLTGQRIPERLGNIHFWLTFVGGWGFLAIWYISALFGGLRRVAVLQPGLQMYSIVAVVFIVVLTVGQLAFGVGLLKGFGIVRNAERARSLGREPEPEAVVK